MQAHAPRFISEEEYWDYLQDSPIKYEYFGGNIYAMAGASFRHNVIASNCQGSLFGQLKGKSCRPVGSDQHVKVEATGLQTFPDVTVVCRDARFDPRRKDTLLEPTVVIEVLSPSTAEYDRTGKFDHFQQIPTLCDYLLVSQGTRRIEHFHRNEKNEWVLETATRSGEQAVLNSIECTLAIDDVYDGVDLPAQLNVLRAPFDESCDD